MVSNFEQSLKYLYSHIPQSTGRMFPGEAGLNRMRSLAKALGDPQEKYKIIHIAGTSGKGSTSTVLSHLIKSQGFKVGLQLSPHIIDIRERVRINNQLLDKKKFVNYLNEIIPAVEKISKEKYGPVSYFEILVALGFYTFWKEKVDYAVIETGLGGLYDGTNIVKNKNKTNVITKIGYDHMAVLGNSLKEIAQQKAGIIQNGNVVITINQEKEVTEKISEFSKIKKSPLTIVEKTDFEVLKITESGTRVYDKKRMQEFMIGLIGKHQAENSMLALETVYKISGRDNWEVNEEKLFKSLQKLRFPGRVDIVSYKDKTLVIDGAHNMQKMSAFLSTLESLYPGEKYVFLLAFKHGKDIKPMIELIEKYTKEIVLTEFWVDTQDMPNISEKSGSIKKFIKVVPFKEFSQPQKALDYVMSREQKVIITGSLYFASEIYKLMHENQ